MAEFDREDGYCPLCGGVGFKLGAADFRCRDCGSGFSDEAKTSATITSWNSVMKQSIVEDDPLADDWELTDFNLDHASEEISYALLNHPNGDSLEAHHIHLTMDQPSFSESVDGGEPYHLPPGRMTEIDWYGAEGTPETVIHWEDGNPQAIYGRMLEGADAQQFEENELQSLYQGEEIPPEFLKAIQEKVVQSPRVEEQIVDHAYDNWSDPYA